jgi:hypothetical protein
LQDSPEDDGTPTAEWAGMEKLLRASLKLPEK